MAEVATLTGGKSLAWAGVVYCLAVIVAHGIGLFAQIDQVIGVAGGFSLFVGEGIFSALGLTMMLLLWRVYRHRQAAEPKIGLWLVTVLTGLFAIANSAVFILLLLMVVGVARD